MGCFFELEPLETEGMGLGGAGNAGTAAGVAGEPAVGGDGGTGGVSLGCNMAGQKLCDGICVPVGPEYGCGDPDSCAPCAPLLNAAAPSCGGDSNRCQVASCNAGFADCDGDMLEYSGASGGNGCEYSFGTIAAFAQPLVAPRAQIQVADGTRDDWSSIPAYRLEHTCVDCEDSVAVARSAQNEVPPPSDLVAYFRVAWNGDFFYVLAEAFDDRVFNAGSTIDIGTCTTNGDYVPGPFCEDAFALYFDGLQNGADYGNTAHRIFLGTSEVSFAPAQGQPPDGTVGMRLLPAPGPQCYRMEAQFDWKLLVSNQGQPVEGKFPPAAGQTYGFDIAVSDWDPAVSDADAFEPQSQLFFTQRPAQSELHPSIAGVGSILLSDHSSSEVAGTPQ